MKVHAHRAFGKAYQKLPTKKQEAVDRALRLFRNNPFAPELRNHRLKGEFGRYRSIDVTGDLRAWYKDVSDNEVLFVKLGTHAQLYG